MRVYGYEIFVNQNNDIFIGQFKEYDGQVQHDGRHIILHPDQIGDFCKNLLDYTETHCGKVEVEEC